MIAVERALELVLEHTQISNDLESISVDDALNRVLAEDILAPLSLPPFRQSIMDGYALNLSESLSYKVIGETKTGDNIEFSLQHGEAIRIFTGAMVPETANAVVMQEHVTVNGSNIELKTQPTLGQHIRNIGAQIKKGDQSLQKGEVINPAGIGILKSFGIGQIKVNKLPTISIITTGNELVPAGNPLEPGQIYESNGSVIQAALQAKGIEVRNSYKVKDSLEATQNAIEKAIKDSDIVLISGGISVGDYDFVSTDLHNLDVKEIFYKVLQKPGKPLYFGKKNGTYLFALPGNPASTLTCLYVYVFTLIDKYLGCKTNGLKRLKFSISDHFENPFGRALFLKAKLEGSEVTILTQQNSAMIMSFARADALVYIPAYCSKLKKGDMVETLILPQMS